MQSDYVDFNALDIPENFDDNTPEARTPSDVAPPMADFIRPLDRMAAYVAVHMYDNPVPREFYGFTLFSSSTHVASWIRDTEAIIGFRGTAIGKEGGFQDLYDDINIGLGDMCDLAIRREGERVLTELARLGYSITLAGHSLGGRAAICLSSLPNVVNTVALNAGAPVTNPEAKTGGLNGTHYHIVGDLISTHVMNMETIRVQIQPQVDWLSPWNHSKQRFLPGSNGPIISAQAEQDDLENWFFERAGARLKAANVVTSLFSFSWYSKAKNLICTNPIPGASPGNYCTGKQQLAATPANVVSNLISMLQDKEAFPTQGFIRMGIKDGDLPNVLAAMLPGFTDLKNSVQNSIATAVKAATGIKKLITTLNKMYA
jgi:hypothetical protein